MAGSWNPVTRLRALLGEGDDPDPRFSFANERTFLAWIRTSLALLAAGVGLEAFVPDALPPLARRVVVCTLLALGAAVAATAFSRWVRSEAALRRGRSLPTLGVAPVVSAGVALCAVALLVGVLAGP